MSRVKVKSVKKNVGDKGVINMFNQMVGADDADPDIVMPKYRTVKSKVVSFSKIIKSAAVDVLSKSFPNQKNGCDEMLKFSEVLNKIEFLDIPENGTPEEKKSVCKHYMELKVNNTIKMLILTCKNLIEYQNFLSEDNKDDNFVSRIPGLSWDPFPFSSINIKEILLSKDTVPRIKKYIFMVLRLSLMFCKEIYKTITSPDVDVKKFSAVIINSIASVKKSIPRCDQAFAKIEESVSLLEGNFDGYYKDFIQSNNPSTIIEGFVIDVSNTGGVDAQTTRQFRKIINYYQKATAGKIKDPKIKKVFDMLNSNFSIMEKSMEEEAKSKNTKKNIKK